MARSSRHTPPAPQYIPAEIEGFLAVLDQLNGYVVSTHDTHVATVKRADQLSADPAEAVAAVRKMDAAMSGPAADVYRMLRRYGYHRAVIQSDARQFFSYYTLTKLTEAGHLVMVWSEEGLPYYTTPVRFDTLTITFQSDRGELIPTAPDRELQRRREALAAMPSHIRRARCEHGLQTGDCGICGPVEAWECDWGTCRANAVTRCAGRRVCEECAFVAFAVAGKRLPEP